MVMGMETPTFVRAFSGTVHFKCFSKLRSVVNVKGESLKNVSESEKLYSIRDSSEVAFAVAKYGDGYVAYFSDVNTETETVAIVAEFLSRARRRRVTLGRLNELVTPEKALKVWADGSCLDNHQTGKPRIGGMGFSFDKKSGFGSYYGPVEDNFHPVGFIETLVL